MTEQITDTLIYERVHHGLHVYPLGDFFETFPPRPAFVAPNSACWRGYLAEWTISNGRLWLHQVSGSICTRPADGGERHLNWCGVGHTGPCASRAVRLADVVGTSGPMSATWFSGRLHAARVNMVKLFDLERGLVTQLEVLTEEEYDRMVDLQRKAKQAQRRRRWRFWVAGLRNDPR